jgi:hypothetical protein
MATTSAPPAAAANARPGPQQPNAALNGTQRFVPPQRQQREVAEPDEADEPDENPPSPPVFTFPQQSPNGFPNQPGQFQNAPNGAPMGITVNPSTGPGAITINPSTPPGQPTAPIGVSKPGMMVNPPAPPPTTTPTTMIRPPG